MAHGVPGSGSIGRQMTTLRRLLPALAAAALVTGSCSGLFEDSKRIGVSGSGDALRAHFVPCPGQLVSRVALLDGTGGGFATETGNDTPGDDEDDDEVVVWSVGAPEGSSDTTFDIGGTPPGFVVEVPLTQPISTYGDIGVFIGFRGGGTVASVEIGFDPGDVPSGAILTLGGEVDPETFQREALAVCD